MSHEKKARESLQERKKLYIQELRKATETTRAVLHEIGHIEADSNIFSNINLSRQIYHTLSKLIEKADEALERIKCGTYGFCTSCKEPISLARLQMVPFTEYCVNCKKEKETKDTIFVNGSRQRISRIQNNITI